MAQPIATLSRAISTAAEKQVSSILIRRGIYLLDQDIVLGPEHAGVSLSGCPGEAVNLVSASNTLHGQIILRNTRGITIRQLRFGATAPGQPAITLDNAHDCSIRDNRFSDNGAAILLNRSSNNRIEGNLVQNAAGSALELRDGSDGNVIEGNVIDGAGASETWGGGIFLHGVSNNLVVGNLVQNTAGMGIGIANWDQTTINISNAVIGNVLRRTALTATDSGAIYLLGRSQLDTQALIASNWIDHVGSAAQHSVGIYLDDSTSGATVVGNVVRGAGSDAVQIHGGSFNLISGNLLDIGGGRSSAVLFQAAPADTNPGNAQVGNQVVRNIIVSTSPTPKVFFWIKGGEPLIRHNLYFNALGASMAGASPTADADPVYADPGFADAAIGDYSFDARSPAWRMGFAPLRRPIVPGLPD